MGTASTTTRRSKSSLRSTKGAPKTATVTVGELRLNFRAVEAKLSKGMRVRVTRRGEVVAEMLPASEVRSQVPAVPPSRFIDRLPQIEARLREIWGDKPVDLDTTALISEGRNRDLLS